MFGAKLSWCQIVRCLIVLVPNCPGAKLSTFIILVPNCPLLISWCQIVRFIMLVPNCPGAKLSGAKLSWTRTPGAKLCGCQIVSFCYLGAKLSGAKLSGANLSYNLPIICPRSRVAEVARGHGGRGGRCLLFLNDAMF